jgi:hypothetical protein
MVFFNSIHITLHFNFQRSLYNGFKYIKLKLS